MPYAELRGQNRLAGALQTGPALGFGVPADALIQNLLNQAAAQPNQLQFAPGDWYFNLAGTALNFSAGGVALVGAGMQTTRLNFNDTTVAGGAGLYLGTALSNAVFSATNVTLSAQMGPADAHQGYQASLAPSGSGAIFSVGQWVQLWDPNESTNFNGRWLGQIAGISGDTLTFEDGTPLTFPVGTRMNYGTLADSLTISDMTLQTTAVGPAANLNSLLSIQNFRNVTVERVKFRNSLQSLAAVFACFNVTFKQCEFEDADSGTSSGALTFFQCMHAKADKCGVIRSRFGLQAQQSPYTSFSNCDYSDTRYDAITLLGGRPYKLLRGCAYSNINANRANGFGSPIYIADSPHCEVAGNRIRQTGIIPSSAFDIDGHGIWVGTESTASPATGGSDHCHIHHNDIEGCGGWGIYLGGLNRINATMGSVVDNNIIVGCGAGGIAMVENGDSIHDNTIDSCGATAGGSLTQAGITTIAGVSDNTIAHNKFRNMGSIPAIDTHLGAGQNFGANDLGPTIASAAPVFSTGSDVVIEQGGASLDYASGSPSSNATIPTAGYYRVKLEPTGNLTGMVLGAGVHQQEIVLQNVTANTVAWAGSGSNVASAGSSGLAGFQTRRFIYDAGSSFWWLQN